MATPYKLWCVYWHLFSSYFLKSEHLTLVCLRHGWINRSLKLTLPSEPVPFIWFSCFSSSSTFAFVSLLMAPDISFSHWGVSTCLGIGIGYGIWNWTEGFRILCVEGFLVEKAWYWIGREQQDGRAYFQASSSLPSSSGWAPWVLLSDFEFSFILLIVVPLNSSFL